ncbi:hypothetical protein LguiB_011756 [Lonicera macranthoides]
MMALRMSARTLKSMLLPMFTPASMLHSHATSFGDVAFRILETVNSVSRRAIQDMLESNLREDTQIYVCDINPNMLNVGKKRAQEKGLGEDGSLIWVEGDAEALKFEDESMGGYTIAFGIRNVTHIEKVIAEAYR